MEQGGNFISFLLENLTQFFSFTGFANFTLGHGVMILVGILFIYLAITKEFEAMKMENNIDSDKEGNVVDVKVGKGDSVLEGDTLVIIG